MHMINATITLGCYSGAAGGCAGVAGEVVEVDFLEEQEGSCLREAGERLPQLDVRHHGAELLAEAAQQGEDEGAVTNGVAELAKRGGHRLEAAAEVRDEGGALLDGAKLGEQQEGARLALPEELVL